jgi:hypothetical protein
LNRRGRHLLIKMGNTELFASPCEIPVKWPATKLYLSAREPMSP